MKRLNEDLPVSIFKFTKGIFGVKVWHNFIIYEANWNPRASATHNIQFMYTFSYGRMNQIHY